MLSQTESGGASLAIFDLGLGARRSKVKKNKTKKNGNFNSAVTTIMLFAFREPRAARTTGNSILGPVG